MNDVEEIQQRAEELLQDPGFLYRVSAVIGSLGVVRELRNRLIVFLATLTTMFHNPVSVLVKGRSSSGKSNLLRAVLKILPRLMVIERSGMSPKALIFGEEKLDGRVLYIQEVRAVAVAQMLLRLIQSEGSLTYERTSMSGPEPGTRVKRRVGSPVVLTTTTDDRIFEDDETRFLSVWADESAEQTHQILRAKLHTESQVDRVELAAVQLAVRVLLDQKVKVSLPSWLETVLDHMPGDVRTRRDATSVLNILRAIALTRYFRSGSPKRRKMEVDFSDYAVAWCLLNDALTHSTSDLPIATGQVIKAAEAVFGKSHKSVSADEIAIQLGWKKATVYRHLNSAMELGLLSHDGKSRPNNEKRFTPTGVKRNDFLLSPQKLLEICPQLQGCKYVDPITGNNVVVTREQRTAASNKVRRPGGLKPKWERLHLSTRGAGQHAAGVRLTRK
jgi:hypothetical protein